MIDPQHTDWRVVALTASITTLIGAVIGFLSAVASELWKSNRTERKECERLEHAIYAEMAELYLAMRTLFKNKLHYKLTDEATARTIKSFTMLDSYNYAKQSPHQFYSLTHAFAINNIFWGMRNIHAPEIPDHMVVSNGTIFCLSVVKAIREHEINVKLFRQASPEAYEQAVEQIEETAQAHDRLFRAEAEEKLKAGQASSSS